MRDWLQHVLNDAHVFCRLKDCGLPLVWAKRAAKTFAWLVRPILYRNRKGQSS